MTPYCTNCGSESLRDRGTNEEGDIRYLCDDCGNTNYYEPGFSTHSFGDDVIPTCPICFSTDHEVVDITDDTPPIYICECNACQTQYESL